jgi:hypothetical protein
VSAVPTMIGRDREDARDLAERNRRTAGWLVLWVVFLVLVSVVVIWVKN